MLTENPVKSVTLCFYRRRAHAELHFSVGDPALVASLAAFLEAGDAVILAADNFSLPELAYLGEWGDGDGRLFAGPECAGRERVGRGSHCEDVCALREQPSKGGAGNQG